MSNTHPSPSSSSNFQLILDNALKVYEKQTKKNLLAHPLAAQLQACNSPTAILAVLQQQVQDFNQSRSTDDRLTRWLDPTINVLNAFSEALGAGVGLAFSPAQVIFAGVGVLLSTARDVHASQETLVDIFERIENFFRRLSMYTEVPPTPEMTDMSVKIMAEVLSILGIATKEIKRSQMKKFLKRLTGRTDLEDALKRLDTLTNEEARMAIAEVLKSTHAINDRVGVVDGRVAGVDEKIVGVDHRVASMDDKLADVDDRVAGMDDRVAGMDDKLAGVGDRVAVVNDRVAAVNDKVASVDVRVKTVNDNIAVVIHDGKETKGVIQQTANDVDQMKQNQLRESHLKWLSPPDPSTNHYIARGAHHEGTVSWFFQGSMFNEWKSTGSLLWIHGKPGSGKTVLCSTIIQDIETMCATGQALMGYFYFDFRDKTKQHFHDLVTSILTQFSESSGPCCDILSSFYSRQGNGTRQPSDDALMQCLKEMLTLPSQRPVYLIIDALDECPDTSGFPSPRERVLRRMKDLINLHLPNLHICITSRPEIDIREALEPLTTLRVSLHDQSGQKKDILDYVRSVVCSDSEPIMRRWRTEDKELVIETLCERADGMFRWVFCQLETLRQCFPPSVRRTLSELPESLDETYERILKEIKKPNRDHALRLLQCLVVAFMPLRVEELAEVLAVDFDDAEGIPKLNPSWRWEDQEQAILSSCSSLITIVYNDDSRVVQFSHFSVKEFLVSPRLATSSEDVSRYFITLEPAHTILAQACLSIFLRADDRTESNSIGSSSPLAIYAAGCWVDHARFGGVSSRLRKPIESLFDPNKPHFVTWRRSYDIEAHLPFTSALPGFPHPSKVDATPLYYAAYCGFHDLAEHLMAEYPEHVNAQGGFYVTPVVAALAWRHFQVAKLLHRKGSSVNLRGFNGRSPLHSAVYGGDLELVEVLLECKAEINVQEDNGKTPLHAAILAGDNYDPKVVRSLLEHGAESNASEMEGKTPLHFAADYNVPEAVGLLLSYGADPNAQTKDSQTPLYYTSGRTNIEAARLLLEHGANPNARTTDGETPLRRALLYKNMKLVRMLLEHKADPNAQKTDGETPLHPISCDGSTEAAQLLLEHSADSNARKTDGVTPLHLASQYGRTAMARMLLERGVNPNAPRANGETPLHLSSSSGGKREIVHMLLEHGADANARMADGETPLHRASRYGKCDVAELLLEHDASPNAPRTDGETPLHRASRYGDPEMARMLLRHGAKPNAPMTDGETPLHLASDRGKSAIAHVLLELGADPNVRTTDGETPLHRASKGCATVVAQMLLEKGADPNARMTNGETPLHRASEYGDHRLVNLLLGHGASVHAENGKGRTAFQVASERGRGEITKLLSEHHGTKGKLL